MSPGTEGNLSGKISEQGSKIEASSEPIVGMRDTRTREVKWKAPDEPIEEPGIPASFRVLVKELQSLGLAVEAVTESGETIRFGKEDDKRHRHHYVGTGLMDLARSRRR